MNPNEPIYEALNKAFASEERIYTLNAPMKATQKMPDGNFKVKPLVGNEEFFLRRVRGGARETFIFEFEPVDTKPYLHVEMNAKVAKTTFPELEAHLITILGDKGVIETFEGAVSNYLKLDQAQKALTEAECVKNAAKPYEGNEKWGMF